MIPEVLTKNERDLLEHALGGTERYRNYFVASCGSNDDQCLLGLHARGLVAYRKYPFADDMRVYRVTVEGLQVLELK